VLGVTPVAGEPGTPTVPGEPGTVVWAKAAPLRPKPSRAVRSNFEEFIIGGEIGKGRKYTSCAWQASQVVLRVARYLDKLFGTPLWYKGKNYDSFF
jgi:hypothetical protein